ncbi:PAS domain S-box protein [Thermodesulfobacteriota bacterium]
MKKFEKKSITQRLFISFCLLILILFSFGLYTLYNIRTISSLTRTIYNHPLMVSNAALQSNVSITKMHRNMKDVVLFEDPQRIQFSINLVNLEEQQVYQNLDILKNRILGDEGKKLGNEARTLFDSWKPIREEVISLVLMGQREKAAQITIGKGADHVAKLEEKMLGLTKYARAKASSFMNEAEKTHSRLKVILITFLLAVLIISSLIAIFSLKQTASSEKNLLESEERFRLAFENAYDGVCLVDTGGNLVKVNNRMCDIFGYSKKELESMSVNDIAYPEDKDISPKFIEKSISGEVESTVFEKRYIHKQGHIIRGRVSSSIIKDAKGDPLYFISHVQDITQKKHLEEQRDKLIVELQKTLSEVKTLRGFLPICSYCKQIRDDNGYWSQIESYIHKYSDAEFSHSICPECAKKHYPDMDIYDDNGEVTEG